MATQDLVLPRPPRKLAVMAKKNLKQRRRSKFRPFLNPSNHLTEYRQTREEREAAYIKARERIFGKEEKSGDGLGKFPNLVVLRLS